MIDCLLFWSSLIHFFSLSFSYPFDFLSFYLSFFIWSFLWSFKYSDLVGGLSFVFLVLCYTERHYLQRNHAKKQSFHRFTSSLRKGKNSTKHTSTCGIQESPRRKAQIDGASLSASIKSLPWVSISPSCLCLPFQRRISPYRHTHTLMKD